MSPRRRLAERVRRPRELHQPGARRAVDDSLDTDFGYRGTIQYLVAATDPTTFNADVYVSPSVSAPNRLTATTYIGAIQNSSDVRFRSWICDTSSAVFGGAGSCTGRLG